MLNREDLHNIFRAALAEHGIEVSPERFEELFTQFLHMECTFDHTKQPITDQVEKFARAFLLSASSQEIWNDANGK